MRSLVIFSSVAKRSSLPIPSSKDDNGVAEAAGANVLPGGWK